MANSVPNAVFSGGQVHTYRYKVENLAAGADIAERAIASWKRAGQIVGVRILSEEINDAGIDGSNTCVIVLQRGSTVAAAVTFMTVTYDNNNGFPAINTVDEGLTLTEGNFAFAADDILSLQVTNGSTADPGPFIVEVDYVGG